MVQLDVIPLLNKVWKLAIKGKPQFLWPICFNSGFVAMLWCYSVGQRDVMKVLFLFFFVALFNIFDFVFKSVLVYVILKYSHGKNCALCWLCG
ncbi:hypothetical protein AQUCO_06000038v1 [Aquilegia coerulea]|uniref:Uncharacterized protein n=1 Tax=Aquilegia coerulea TaxID=218851 RepID=A0A2G5CDP5_AQUCA|nr:hypothetical protein AQUCO_06000038v1 [Aquilegia coerulea]